jgi:peptidyl-dipeptidase Dcp
MTKLRAPMGLRLPFLVAGLFLFITAQSEPSEPRDGRLNAVCESHLHSIDKYAFLEGISTRVPWQAFPISELLPTFKSELALARRNVQRLERLRVPRTQMDLEDVIWALNTYSTRLDRFQNVFYQINSTAQSESMSAIAAEIAPESAKFSVEFGQNEKIAKLVAEILTLDQLTAGFKLSTAQKRFLTDFKNAFVNNGVYLEPAKKSRLSEISARMATLSTKFKENVTNYIKANPFHVEDIRLLKGVPRSVLATAVKQARTANKKGALLLLNPSQGSAALEYITDRTLREKLWRALARRAFDGPYNNRPLALEILKLRKEEAQILGHENYAQAKLQDRMISSPEKLEAFLKQLTDAARPQALQDMADLAAFAKSKGLAEALQPWDAPYYSKLLMIEKYSIDSEEFRPYLEFENILKNGVFAAFSRLHKVRFVENTRDDKPNKDVRIIDIYRENDNWAPIGRVYLDPFQRPGEKREGAWEMSMIKEGIRPDGSKQIPVVGIALNILKAEKGPTLIKIDDANTLLHEFGHGFHDILSQVALEAQSGTSVSWDFVEVPSMFMENYLDFILENVAKHHITREKVPVAMLEKLKASKHFQAASGLFAKLRMSYLDFRLHTYGDIDQVTDVYELETTLIRDFEIFEESRYRGWLLFV